MDPFVLRIDHPHRVHILEYHLHVQLSASHINHPRIGLGARDSVVCAWRRRPRLSPNDGFGSLWADDWSTYFHEPRVGTLRIRVLCGLSS
jgi:hypothetical protein